MPWTIMAPPPRMRRQINEILLYAPGCKAVKGWRTVSIQWFLRAPLQPGKVRIFAVLAFWFIVLFSFTLKAARFFLALFALPRFLAISFCERCFAWSCDDALLGLRRVCARKRMCMLLGSAASPLSRRCSGIGGRFSGCIFLTGTRRMGSQSLTRHGDDLAANVVHRLCCFHACRVLEPEHVPPNLGPQNSALALARGLAGAP